MYGWSIGLLGGESRVFESAKGVGKTESSCTGKGPEAAAYTYLFVESRCAHARAGKDCGASDFGIAIRWGACGCVGGTRAVGRAADGA